MAIKSEETLEKVLGQRVANIRVSRHMTQADLAAAMSRAGHEMHQTTLAKLESGRRPIRVNEVGALADILDVGLSDLIPMERTDFGEPTPRLKAQRRAMAIARGLEMLQDEEVKLIRQTIEVQQQIKITEEKLEAALELLREEREREAAAEGPDE